VDQTVASSDTATLAVVADGSSPMSFQWQKDGAPVAGATSAALTLASLRRADGGYYSVVVSNSFGTAASAEARVRVLVPQVVSGPFAQTDGSTLLGARDSDGGLLTDAEAPFFEVWASTNLVDWELLPSAVTVSNGALRVQDLAATNWPCRFYRFGEKALGRVAAPQQLAAPLPMTDGSWIVGFGDSTGGRLTLGDLGKFQVRVSTNLTDWETLAATMTITNGRVWLRDSAGPTAPRRFYQVVEEP
jgi:hypothetical protein